MNTSTPLLNSSFGAIDYLVIGGGSSGCALASRLSADPSVRVVLVGAGGGYLPGAGALYRHGGPFQPGVSLAGIVGAEHEANTPGRGAVSRALPAGAGHGG